MDVLTVAFFAGHVKKYNREMGEAFVKKIWDELKSQNIFYYIIVFSIIVILIITSLGSYLYQFYYKTIYSDFLVSNEEHLDAEINRHENDMQIIKNIVYQMGITEDVTKFRLSENPQAALQLEKHLFQYITVSQFFQMLLYQYHEDDYMYTGTTSVGVDYFAEQGCVMELLDAEEVKAEIRSTDKELRIWPEQSVSGFWIQMYMGGEDMVLYMQAIPPAFQETLLFVVPGSYYDSLMEKDEEDLMEKDEEDLREDFIIYKDEVIVSRGSLELPSDAILPLSGEEEGQRQVKIDGKKYLLSVRQGTSGLTYCSLQSMEVFYDKIVTGQWGIIVLLSVCAIPAAFFIMVFSRRMAAKVKKMNQLLDSQEETNYNLSSIESGIQMLVEANEQKEKENLQLKKTRFVRNFIRNDFKSREEVLQAAQKASIEIENTMYLAVLLGERSDSNESRAHAMMLDVIAQAAHLDGYGIHLVSNNQSLFVLFSDSAERIEETLGMLFTIGKECHGEFVMSVSNYHQDFLEGSAAYLEADTAFDNRFLQDNNKIIRFGDVALTDVVNVLPDSYLQKLKAALRSRDKAAVEQAVEDICRRMTKKSPSLPLFRLLYNDIIHVLISEWKAENTGLESIYNVFTLSQCLTIQDFNDFLCEACSRIIETKPEESVDRSRIVEEAAAYMKENFAKPELTMSMLADYLGISSVTLAVEFKNQMDIRPSDYLANLRMERARELLVSTNMLVREISLSVGYEDDHVFTRRFKKYTGKTPGQYREEHTI